MKLARRTFLGASAAAVLAASASAQEKRLRACVIGDTKQGGYGHSLQVVWDARKDVDVVGLSDPDEAGRAKCAAEAKARRSYSSHSEMLQKEKPDLVAISPRWTLHHKEYLLAAAACGAHGILEKPIAAELVEADEMIQAVDAKNLRWAIAFNFRVSPMIAHAKRLICEKGIIGDVLEMRGRGKEDHRAGGEDLLVLGTHVFDLMRHFAGDPSYCAAEITVSGRRATKADIHEATEPLGPVLGDRIHASYGFANGITGFFASAKNQHGDGGRWGLDILGSKGIVTIRLDVIPKISILRNSAWTSGTKWEPLPDAPVVKMENPNVERNAPIVDDLIAALRERRRPLVSLHDGRASLEMVQAVYESHVRGSRVEFPLKERVHPLKRWA